MKLNLSFVKLNDVKEFFGIRYWLNICRSCDQHAIEIMKSKTTTTLLNHDIIDCHCNVHYVLLWFTNPRSFLELKTFFES